MKDYTCELLLIVPHPDDEVFGLGAMLARMSQRGNVATLTLTRGAAGRTLGLVSREELPALRERELRAALSILGVQDVTILDYQDYVPDDDRGMPRHPGIVGANQERLLADIVSTIERLRPRVVFTFPPNGSNGHPDHCHTNRLVLEALAVTQHTPRLYYFASPAAFAGPQREGFLPEEQMHALKLPVTHSAPAAAELNTKLAAMACHETQALSVLGFMRTHPGRLTLETFHRALPPVESGEASTIEVL